MGRIVIQIAYGEHIWNTIGKELVSLHVEAIGLVTSCLNRFWFVDVFRSCKLSALWPLHIIYFLHCFIKRSLTMSFLVRFLPSWTPGVEFQ
jgi:hypothetical protein